jgi:glutamine amidotransferase
MCELFSTSYEKPQDIRKLLRSFYNHSVKHCHGWGLITAENNNLIIQKEPVAAYKSKILDEIIEKITPQTTSLAHIRLATIGSINIENCHPFSGEDISKRKWFLIHNGTIYSGIQLTKYFSLQTGSTDSERIFLYMIDKINEKIKSVGHSLSMKERFDVISEMIADISPRNKLNLMIYDGELLYVHKNMNDTLFYRHTQNGFVFSTAPLDENEWKEYPMTQVCAFKDGKIIFHAPPHNNVFVPNIEYIDALAAMNI